jgi:hypothetical protein
MDQPLYDIYFTGNMVEGVDVNAGKSNLAALFKLSTEQVSKYFDGKAHLLKRGIDKNGALKYKAALHKAGLMVAVRAHTPPSQMAANTEKKAPPETQQSSTEEDWSLAPAGSDVLKPNERKSVEKRDIDTSEIKMVSAFMNTDPEPKPDIPPPDTRHISLAPTGEDLVEASTPPPPPAMNIENIDLAPPGADLEEIHPDITPLNPDTSKLSIAEPGVELLEGQSNPPPPPAPNTDHITVKEE